MISLFHGEDVTACRNALPEDAIKVDGKTATPELLAQLFSGRSLFEGEKTVVLENPKNLPAGIADDTNLILWFDHKLTPNQIKEFAGASVQEFKLNQIVFKFVESLRPANQREMLTLFKKYCSQEYPEIILAMIVRQFRLLLNPRQLAGWQKDRVAAQAKRFTPQKLRAIYKTLLQIDYEQKTGQAVSSLQSSLELFLLNL